jgi:hypothetical protein
MKAEKRVRYGEKELQRLKDMLTKAGDYQMVPEAEQQTETIDEEKIPITALPRPKSQTRKVRPRRGEGSSRSRKSRLEEFYEGDGRDDDDDDAEDVEMKEGPDGGDKDNDGDSMSVDKAERVFNKRTMRDQFGNYPEWMNKRKMMTQKKKNKRIAKNRAVSLAGGKRNKRR